jgi:hypothetical protein
MRPSRNNPIEAPAIQARARSRAATAGTNPSPPPEGPVVAARTRSKQMPDNAGFAKHLTPAYCEARAELHRKWESRDLYSKQIALSTEIILRDKGHSILPDADFDTLKEIIRALPPGDTMFGFRELIDLETFSPKTGTLLCQYVDETVRAMIHHGTTTKL